MSPEKDRENDIPKSSLTSPVTTDMANTEDDEARAAEAEAFVETDPLVASGVGLVKVDGIGKQYIGLPPARDPIEALTPGGLKIHPENSTFMGISQVPFSRSIEIKDPATGEFYYPKDTDNAWTDCELNGTKLIPDLPTNPEVPIDARAAKKDADKDADKDAEAKRKAKEEEDKKARK